MDDLDNIWLEAVHIKPIFSSLIVKEIRKLIVQYKAISSLIFSVYEFEENSRVNFPILLKESSTSAYCSNEPSLSPKN